VKYPYADNGDFLVYHRLTGLERGSIEDVQALIDQGAVLQPFDERGGGEEGEMYGLDPIDIAAGDGGAIFLSPFQPFMGGWLGKPHLRKAPGVAFRLADLVAMGAVTVRPSDFQSDYMEIFSGDLDVARIEMQYQVEDVYNRAGEMEPLSDAFHLIREAEVDDAVYALNSIKNDRASEFSDRRFKRSDLYQEAKKAAVRASEFVSEFEFSREEHEDDEDYWNHMVEEITEGIANAVTGAFDKWEWSQKNLLRNVEVLFWGSLPISKAAIIFDNATIIRNRNYQSGFDGLNGIAMPAGRR
jgi:hypothetical protein